MNVITHFPMTSHYDRDLRFRAMFGRGRYWYRNPLARRPDSGGESRAWKNARLQPAGIGRHPRAESGKDPEPGKARSAVSLLVEGNGCGMDAETQAWSFEPFSTTKRPGAGTGLRQYSAALVMRAG